MKLPWGRVEVPPAVRAATGDDKVIATVTAESPEETLVAGTKAMYAVSADGSLRWRRVWHHVDGGSFDRESSTLRVTWVDGSAPEGWRLPHDTTFPETFRARVQASVVLAEIVDLGGRRNAKVVIRKDLADQSLLSQVVIGRGVDPSDPGLRAAVAAAVARLEEQVGLD